MNRAVVLAMVVAGASAGARASSSALAPGAENDEGFYIGGGGGQVNVKIGNTSDEMLTLMRTGNYDGVSASGDATLRLIAGGDVAPVNTDLIPNYADV